MIILPEGSLMGQLARFTQVATQGAEITCSSSLFAGPVALHQSPTLRTADASARSITLERLMEDSQDTFLMGVESTVIADWITCSLSFLYIARASGLFGRMTNCSKSAVACAPSGDWRGVEMSN